MGTAHAVDADETTFATRVLERSREVPVVVDFWAEWCGPCRALGPVLEAEVARAGGRVELVKVDTDANPELAARYQIRGIPAVKAFRDGKVVDEFVGALPAQAVRAFLEKQSPSEERRLLDALVTRRARGDLAIAGDAAALLARPGLPSDLADAAALLLAEAELAAGRIAEAEAALARVDPRGANFEAAESLQHLVGLARDAQAGGGEEVARGRLERDPKDKEARYALGCALAARGAVPEALEQLLELVASGGKEWAQKARRAMVAVFEQPTADPEVVRDYRRKLMILS